MSYISKRIRTHWDRIDITDLRGDHTKLSDYVTWIKDLNDLTPEQITELTDRSYAVVQRIYCQALEPHGAWMTVTGCIYQYAEGAPLPGHWSPELRDLVEMIDLQIDEDMQEVYARGRRMQV